jgi:Coenzyme PQQ synthesis protein D (PqqD)
MWQLVTSSPTVEAALAQIVNEYDAEPETLRADLAALLEHLVENRLIAMQCADVGIDSAV